MSAVGIISEAFDESTLRAVMIRWQIAQHYLKNEPGSNETGKLAVETLINRDLPALIRELARLRQDVS